MEAPRRKARDAGNAAANECDPQILRKSRKKKHNHEEHEGHEERQGSVQGGTMIRFSRQVWAGLAEWFPASKNLWPEHPEP